MVCDERLASFINSFNTDYDEVVTSIRREAEENRVPIIRREAGEFTKGSSAKSHREQIDILKKIFRKLPKVGE